jgi:hypothetical protein
VDDLFGLLGQDDFSAYDLSRLRDLLDGAMWRLPEEDRDARILHCWTTGQHGVRMVVLPDEQTLAFWWGGKPLLHLDKRRLLRAGSNPAELS